MELDVWSYINFKERVSSFISPLTRLREERDADCFEWHMENVELEDPGVQIEDEWTDSEDLEISSSEGEDSEEE
jgi:hypothetical protein